MKREVGCSVPLSQKEVSQTGDAFPATLGCQCDRKWCFKRSLAKGIALS